MEVYPAGALAATESPAGGSIARLHGIRFDSFLPALVDYGQAHRGCCIPGLEFVTAGCARPGYIGRDLIKHVPRVTGEFCGYVGESIPGAAHGPVHVEAVPLGVARSGTDKEPLIGRKSFRTDPLRMSPPSFPSIHR